MDGNRVSVKIYGQEYVISGEKSREHIIKVADYVDMKMHEIAKVARSASNATLAALAAVNIADEYYNTQEKLTEQCKLTAQMEKDAQHYVQLWDEAKKSFMQYKNDASNMAQQKEELIHSLQERDEEIRSLKEEVDEASKKARNVAADQINELKAKCRELENGFFDLQMENIRLKSELERYRRSQEK